ncbi:hypothetical protein MLD38_028858 [Melastoma candidum]|uniref:Uncharacterized protein n=1 Tax=Melastoma candidum TaxID=119954 RepID=A0ACB9N3U9_9MYRT|nr:hypothetical protein MLD38_028858 [Melastoma candidum]
MAIKLCNFISLAVFLLTSIPLTLLYFPSRLSDPVSRFRPTDIRPAPVPRRNGSLSYPVAFAYLVQASRGDTPRLKRLLRSIYHPGNYYLIHVESGAPEEEHLEVARMVEEEQAYVSAGNVWVIGRSNPVSYRGPTMLSTTMHGMAAMLRICDWDWFINLSASDYPLVTQDDLIHAFSVVPKEVNFIQHTSNLGWKLEKRAKPIVIDPGLYSRNKSDLWWVIKQRSLPTAFKLYSGSAWTVLSRSFAEYVILGWDNFPRTLLLYYTNFVSTPEGYFQTLACNLDDYRNTTANHDLRYITWDNPPKQHPRYLGLKDFRGMVRSNRPFARKFRQDDPVLDAIDRRLLKRPRNGFTHGGWCPSNGKTRNKCSVAEWSEHGLLEPGHGASRLKNLLHKVLSTRDFTRKQCK